MMKPTASIVIKLVGETLQYYYYYYCYHDYCCYCCHLYYSQNQIQCTVTAILIQLLFLILLNISYFLDCLCQILYKLEASVTLPNHLMMFHPNTFFIVNDTMSSCNVITIETEITKSFLYRYEYFPCLLKPVTCALQ